MGVNFRIGKERQRTFPLSVDASGRYLKQADGTPFLIHGDTPWSISAQLTNAEITTYLNDRAAKGFNTILFNAPEPYYTSQTPTYRNVDGNDPFTSMTDFASGLNSAYWSRVDHIVNSAKALGMLCIINPAYSGYSTGSADGWGAAIDAESAGDLQAYGAALANRYTQGNVIWSLGGDLNAADTALRDKQANILTGIRSVRTTDIVMGHHNQDGNDAYPVWSGTTGWNLNIIYGWETEGRYVYTMAATAYSRSGPIPFLGFEFKYENGSGYTESMLRRQSYGSILSGACGQLFGNNPIWYFSATILEPDDLNDWTTYLDSTGSVQQQYVKALFAAYAWWKLEPKTDTSLVSSSLSTNATRLYPALASDGAFAMIYVPTSQTVTVVTNALSGVAGNVRIRLYDPTDGTYSVHQASVAKSSGQSVATGGERVIVVDAA